jgi:hypothetical protein
VPAIVLSADKWLRLDLLVTDAIRQIVEQVRQR